MPRENKKRGRRGQTKRKLDEVVAATTSDGEGESAKRIRIHENTLAEGEDHLAQNRDYEPLDQDGGQDAEPIEESYPGVSSADTDRPFYGLLDEEEQEYFRKTDEMLELDDFADPAQRALFLESIYKEADGKELKMACSQSCSRLMEKLIHLSTPTQLSKLFQKFNGHFLNLVQHRFASHCCEKLFIRAAPIVTEELLRRPNDLQSATDDEVYVPMENLFLHTIAEFDGNLGFLMTDRFASHTLRLLLLILAGEPLTSNTNKSLIQSKKKEKVVTSSSSAEGGDLHLDQMRTVPKSFTEALEKLLTDCVAGLHTQGLRTLALHPTGSPILQVLMRLELTHFGKSRAREPTSILRTLLPDDPISQGTESAGFINGLNYDPIGSHLLEVIIEHTPGKMFKHLYKEFWKDRLASLSRSEIAAFLVCKILERISRDDLIDAHELIVPVIPDLIEKNRVLVVKTLMQRCAVRNVDTQAVAVAIDAHFQGEDGFDILKLLRLDRNQLEARYAERRRSKQTNGTTLDAVNGTNNSNHTHSDQQPVPRARPAESVEEPSKLQGSILAQAMVLVPGPLSGLIFDAMPMLPPSILFEMAADPVISRTLQATMTSTNASIIPRRKLVQQFYGTMGDMALDKSASHVVDAIWEGTHGLAFIRERIAEELAENEPALRDSPYGRAVWKNWKMDLYKRRRQEWVFQSRNKASNDGFQSFEELDKNKKRMEGDEAKASVQTTIGAAVREAVDDGTERKKTPLEKARERHAAQKKSSRERSERGQRASSKKDGKFGKPGGGGPASGANATAAL